ncbi:MAG: maleylpyruvate isomerase N-terminal domain-containing protein, partial [Rhodothermales bacterium]
MQPVEPIFTVELFPPLHAELLALLRNLSDDDWEKSTAARLWAVKDIVAHLLDGDIRRLSFQRDNLAPLRPNGPIEDYWDLVDFLNQMNADWVKAARRISPPLLIAFLEMTGPQVYAFYKTLDPFAPAFYPVAWAGDKHSPHW